MAKGNVLTQAADYMLKHTRAAKTPGAAVKGFIGDFFMAGPRVVGAGVNGASHVVGGAANAVAVGSIKGTGKGIFAVIKAPFIGVYKLGKGGVGLIARNPIPAAILAAGAGVMAWGAHEHDKAARRTQENAMNSMVGAYTNSVSPEEYAALVQRQNQGGGHAGAVTAAREAAAQASAPVAPTA